MAGVPPPRMTPDAVMPKAARGDVERAIPDLHDQDAALGVDFDR